MGAWDTGSFDNDDAMDWVLEFVSKANRDQIESTFRTILDNGDAYLEAPDCSIAIAAAEVVAALKDAPNPNLPEELKQVLDTKKISVDSGLTNLAIRAIEQIKADSELQELWEEEDPSEWISAVDDLEKRLQQ